MRAKGKSDQNIDRSRIGGQEHISRTVAGPFAGEDSTDAGVYKERDLLNKIIDGLPGTFYLLNRKGRFLKWNRHLEEISEFTPEEMGSAHPTDFFADEDKATVETRIKEVFANGFAETEADLVTKSGRRIPHYFNGVLIEIGGEPYVMGMGLDISLRKRVEEELRSSEERLATVLRAGRMGTWVWNLDTNTSVFNQQEFELLGLAPLDGPVSLEVFFERVHPDDREDLERRVREAIEVSGYFEHEFRIIRMDAEIRWVAGRGLVVSGPSGGPRQMFGVNFDVTDHMRHEEELERTNYLLEMVLNNIPQGVFWKDRNSVYLGCNTVVSEAAGFDDPVEMVGISDKDIPITPPEQVESFIQEDRQVIESGNPLFGVIQPFPMPDGRSIWLETNKVPLRDSQGEIVGVLGTWTDITEKRRLEEQLRQSQKMEAFGQLAAGVAHDFNNLLTVITGYSDILLMNLEQDDPRRGAVVSIGDAADRAAALTRQLLAFSRLAVLDPRVTDLNKIIGEMDKILRRLTWENIVFSTLLADDLRTVKVDQSQIGQVLLNLVINARDAMPDGGTLTIATENLALDEERAALLDDATPGNYVMLAVSDTGIGMKEEELRRIFEPFYTTKETGKGTGLGLAVVHGIVKQSGGIIEVISEPDAGSTFKIYLPVVEEDRSVAVDDRTASGTLYGGETILLVEDEAAVRSFAKFALEDLGYEVIEAADGHEAIQIAETRGGEIDLLLTDVVMPGLDGRNLAEELTSRFPHLKVLFVSAYTDDAVVRHEILGERVAFLPKPYSPTALAAKVREVLGNSKPV